MTLITEVTYIVDPVKEWNVCHYLEQAMESERDGWDWEINTTTKSYKYIKRKVSVIQ